jgi:histidinol-phosphatase (PHP family)
METEWIHAGTLGEINALRGDVDYIVGSLHHLNSIPLDWSFEMFSALLKDATLDEVFDQYFDAQFDMLQLKPEVAGHFDLIRIWHPTTTFNPSTWEKIRRNIAFIAGYGGLVELNSRAFKKGMKAAYPLPDVLKVMIEMDIKFTLSDDSHGPDDVGMHYALLFRYMKEHGIHTVYSPGIGGAVVHNDVLSDPFWAMNKFNE